ncbi:sensor histidine kinase [Gimesia aquarii]|uniref:histidine kinase n=1 Tax=Gimesia aquarii TaxID=2527964 RepID=A0A517X2A7_9PLAN|nr:ATP-binding protein [Gimesia aquarii]QDU11644.1 Sporulation kinase E [Gimesia aquarii]
MSSEAGIVGGQLPDAYYRRLFSLVPARSLSSVISELSLVWCEATAAEAVYLAVLERENLKLSAGIFRSSENEAHCFNTDSIELSKDRPITEQTQSVFEQGQLLSQISETAFDYFSFSCDQAEIAGVYVFSSTKLTDEVPVISQLINLSQRLLSQALEQRLQNYSALKSGNLPEPNQNLSFGQKIVPSSDKLEAMAEFAAGAGHEINNPVATIVGRVQMLLKEETDPQRRQSLATIGGQAYRIRDMIGDAMLFARPPAPHPVSLNLQEMTQEVLNSLNEKISKAGVDVSIKLSSLLAIWADEVQWKVVLSNLILNSLQVLKTGDCIEISAEEMTQNSIRIMHIRVVDDGPGLTEQEKEHLFDPFFSARQAGRGLGFGLSKCWRIISLHGGSIEAEVNADRGMTFHLYWPIEGPKE